MFRELTNEEIEKISLREGVKKNAVENFLGTITNNKTIASALLNLERDARLYRWNRETTKAIEEGIIYSATCYN